MLDKIHLRVQFKECTRLGLLDKEPPDRVIDGENEEKWVELLWRHWEILIYTLFFLMLMFICRQKLNKKKLCWKFL